MWAKTFTGTSSQNANTREDRQAERPSLKALTNAVSFLITRPERFTRSQSKALRLAGVMRKLMGGVGGWNILRVPYLLPPRVVHSRSKPTGPPLIDLPWLYFTFGKKIIFSPLPFMFVYTKEQEKIYTFILALKALNLLSGIYQKNKHRSMMPCYFNVNR